EEVEVPWTDPWPHVEAIWSAAMAASHADDLDQVRHRLDPGLLAVIEAGRTKSGLEVWSAMLRRAEFRDQVRRFMEGYDLLLTPTLPCVAFPAGADKPETICGRETTFLGWTPFTYPFNLTGQPAATVPCGFTGEGLPAALQIVGRWRDDVTVLRAAAAFEEA